MEIVNAILEHYHIDNECIVSNLTDENMFSKEWFERRSDELELNNIDRQCLYPLDVLDHKRTWSHGRVRKICFDIPNLKWILTIIFPNWNETIEIDVPVSEETHTQLLPYGTKLLTYTNQSPNFALIRNNPVDSKRRVTCYISSESQTLKKNHKWHMGVQFPSGKVWISASKRFLRSREFKNTIVPKKQWNLIPVNTTYITFPCTTSIRNNEMRDFFRQQETMIYGEVKRRVDLRKMEKKRAMQQIKKNNEIILNKHTVQYFKNNPRIVKKSSFAWKKGWINKYGKPKTWQLSSPILCKSVLRYLSHFMSGPEIIRLAMTNTKHNFELLNHTQLKSQHQSLMKKEIQNQNELDCCEHTRKIWLDQYRQVEKAIHNLPKIRSLKEIRKNLQMELQQMRKSYKLKQNEIKTKENTKKILKAKLFCYKKYL